MRVLARAYAVGKAAKEVCGSSTIELERLAAIQALTVAHFSRELLDHRMSLGPAKAGLDT